MQSLSKCTDLLSITELRATLPRNSTAHAETITKYHMQFLNVDTLWHCYSIWNDDADVKMLFDYAQLSSSVGPTLLSTVLTTAADSLVN